MTPEEAYNEALRDWGLRGMPGEIPAACRPVDGVCPCIFCKGNRDYEAKLQGETHA